MDQQNDGNFFVRLNNAKDVRRAILEASRDIIVCMKRYEKFKLIRETKEKSIKQLSEIFKDINDISAELKIDVPDFARENLQETEPPIATKEQEEKHDAEEPEIDDLKKLENSIADIESKLNNLG